MKRVHFTYLRRLVTDLLRHEAGRELVQDLKDQAYSAPPPDLSETGALVPMTPGGSVPVAQAADRPQAPFLSLMELTGIAFGVRAVNNVYVLYLKKKLLWVLCLLRLQTGLLVGARARDVSWALDVLSTS